MSELEKKMEEGAFVKKQLYLAYADSEKSRIASYQAKWQRKYNLSCINKREYGIPEPLPDVHDEEAMDEWALSNIARHIQLIQQADLVFIDFSGQVTTTLMAELFYSDGYQKPVHAFIPDPDMAKDAWIRVFPEKLYHHMEHFEGFLAGWAGAVNE